MSYDYDNVNSKVLQYFHTKSLAGKTLQGSGISKNNKPP